ncbi:MAG: pilus assembly protein [Candidatus Aureabacteria bacterium]|nr:pilus assembly protein [Candidatus Auribacterota bacterium]
MEKNKFIHRKKGAALAELLIIAPIIIVMLGIIWDMYNVFIMRYQGIQAAHYAVWEKVDARHNKSDNQDPRWTYLVQGDAQNIARSKGGTAGVTLSEQSTLDGALGWTASRMIALFGLNNRGKWKATVQQNAPLSWSFRINDLIPGGDVIPGSISWTLRESLVTDSWDSRHPTENAIKGDVIDRVAGAWFGLLDITGGSIANFVRKIFQFQILGWKIGPDEPRVNLSAVPPSGNRS